MTEPRLWAIEALASLQVGLKAESRNGHRERTGHHEICFDLDRAEMLHWLLFRRQIVGTDPIPRVCWCHECHTLLFEDSPCSL